MVFERVVCAATDMNMNAKKKKKCAIFRTLPHHALGPELTSDYKERASLYAYHETFYLLGVIFAAAAPGILAQYISDTREIFFILALTVALLLVITFAVLLYVIEEPPQVQHAGNPLVPGLRRAWRNHPFRILCYVSVIGSIAHHCTALMFPFYIRSVVALRHIFFFFFFFVFLLLSFLFFASVEKFFIIEI